MKNLLFGALVMLMGTFAIANTINCSTHVSEALNQDSLHFTLDLGNLNDLSHSEIEAKINDFIKNNLNSEEDLECSVTVTGSVSVGVVSVDISVTVTGPCKEVAANGAEIAHQVLTAVTEEIKALF